MSLLVTTGLEETWGDKENLIFLGNWCKRYDLCEKWEKRKTKVVPFHWNDRNKLHNDIIYLKSLHDYLLKSLTKSLNKYFPY